MNDTNQMVSVPCELLEQALDAAAAAGMQDVADELDRILTPSTKKQHQSEPSVTHLAASDVLAERSRQVEAEGYTSERDDQYTSGQLADAASTYAFWARTWNLPHAECTLAPTMWPWAPETWKPQSQRQMLIKAGALILAEIERLDRQQAGEVRHD
ncbi:hypothetical protein JET68_25815 [Pseudomonas monteilii]|uniref:hypothetical protein n=1 Tax=Pseudomonas monteilii TaxID=76759 RepID=UPI0018E67BB4|nr:hypothetical protein [Pseudomonas monteilii]MBI6922208.1 hypothetical protein [Pseudomonas monteilii]